MRLSLFTDPDYLRTQQYGTAANLNARIELHRRFSVNKQGWMPWLFQRLELPAQAQVLETGCGPGSYWLENAGLITAGWKVTLSDLSIGMVKQARQNLNTLAPQIDYAQCDAQAIPFPTASFDAIIANFMLQHVPDRMKALREFRRMLKPRGCLHLSTNGIQHLAELKTLLQGFDPSLGSFWEENPFPIEVAEAELRQVFALVRLERYEDALEVTEAEPLVAYIYSLISLKQAQLGDRDHLKRFIQGELDRDGVIHITKSPGLFICSL